MSDLLKALWGNAGVRRAAVGLATAVTGALAVYAGSLEGTTAALAVAALGVINATLSNLIPKDA